MRHLNPEPKHQKAWCATGSALARPEDSGIGEAAAAAAVASAGAVPAPASWPQANPNAAPPRSSGRERLLTMLGTSGGPGYDCVAP